MAVSCGRYQYLCIKWEQARRKQFWIGGGKDRRGAHDFFLSGAHQWRSQLFGMGGGGGTNVSREKKIAHRTRGKYFVIIIFLTYC